MSIFKDTTTNEALVVGDGKEKAYKAGGSKMKQVITLGNGTRIEIDGSDMKHFGADGNLMYESEVVSSAVVPPEHFFLMGER